MFARILALTLLCTFALGRPAWADTEAAKETCHQGSERELNGDDDGALRYYHAALGQDPDYAEAWRMIGYLEGRRKHYKDALEALDQYLQANVTDLTVRNYADALKEESEKSPEKQDPPRAEEGNREAGAAQDDGQDTGAQAAMQRGLERERAGDFAAALLAYQAVLVLDGNFSEAWRGVGNCQARLGHKEKALDAYDRYMAVHPEDQAVRAYAKTLRKGHAKSRASERGSLQSFVQEQQRTAEDRQRHMDEQFRKDQEGAEPSPEESR